MVIKTIRYKTKPISRHIDYLFRDAGKNPELDRLAIFHNIRNRHPEGAKRAFHANDDFRKRKNIAHRRKGYRENTVHSYDEIMSFSKKDTDYLRRNPHIAQDLAAEFAFSRFGRDSVFVIVLHEDKSHFHAHIYAHGTKYRSFEANRADNEKFKAVRKEIEEIQSKRYPFLDEKSLVFKNIDSDLASKKKGRSASKSQEIRASERGTPLMREKMGQQLQKIWEVSNSSSDFLKRVEEKGIRTYSRKIKGRETPYGVYFRGNEKLRFSTAGIDLSGNPPRKEEPGKYARQDSIVAKYARKAPSQDAKGSRDGGRDLEKF